MSDALVHRDDDDRIAVITLDSPANRNALSRRLIAELTNHLTEAGADESLHGILLRSSHPVFCAGADLKEAATVDMVESARGIIALQRAIVSAPVPVVTRLDGPVRAGGLGLVASSDIVVCADSVAVALTEVRLGLAAAVISIPLRASLSPRAASDWFLTGRPVSATEARDQGLVTHVATADEMDAVVAGVLDHLRAGARQGLVEAKRLLTHDLLAQFDSRGDELARLSGLLFHSEVAQQRMAAALRR
ncbi:enoyl-CoA hydratase family protein [Ornithinibacter aureus]|uniref:Enoyl-CoA hydratase family protein n=1 Tax=Ornithinibacter aureus TaxID=622664 RepID=A0ABP8JQB6_9MICO|nr:enoyl-CoA hydratase-related protein [Ornithinibacter aureus]KAF0834476.1 enoyl-CoA hydratase [Ornithinibacter aureus]